MAITTAAQLAAKLSSQTKMAIYSASISSLSGGAFGWYWATTKDVASGSLTFTNVTNGVVFNNETVGALKFPGAGGSSDLYLAYLYGAASAGVHLMLYDILWGAGPIPTSIAQTLAFTDQPTAWQDRVYGDYKTVQPFFVQAVAQGSYATTVTISYTNENDVAGRTGTVTESLSGNAVANMRPIRLDAGDCGVKSVESVTVSGTVSASGVLDLILARLIAVSHIKTANVFDPPLDPATLILHKVHPASCLSIVGKSVGTNPVVHLQAGFIKG